MNIILTSFLVAASMVASMAAAATINTIAGTGTSGRSGEHGLATNAQIGNPYGIVRGPDRAIYVCEIDTHVIRRIDANGIITTAAGNGRRGHSGDGGAATNASLNEPYEVRFDRAGNMVFVEMKNHLIRRVDAKSGIISTIAGSPQPGLAGDGGPASAARFSQPHSIQFDREDNLYICDIGNHRLRRIDARTGVITTVSGTGARQPTPDGAPFATVPLNGPRAIDFDRNGNLWLALREGNAVYKLDLSKGTIHHVAGTGKKGFTGNGGSAKQATLSGPKGLSLGPDGNVYLADTESHSIRRIDVQRGTLEVIAGTGSAGDGPDGDPLLCRMARPHGVFVDTDGSVLVGDSETHRVRLIRR